MVAVVLSLFQRPNIDGLLSKSDTFLTCLQMTTAVVVDALVVDDNDVVGVVDVVRLAVYVKVPFCPALVVADLTFDSRTDPGRCGC